MWKKGNVLKQILKQEGCWKYDGGWGRFRGAPRGQCNDWST